MRNTLDMTKGKPLPLLIQFALPVMLTSVLQQMYTMADSIIVSRYLGIEAFAAVGAAGFAAWLPQNMFLGFSHGLGAVLSQLFGAGDKENFRLANQRAVSLSTALAMLFSLVLVLIRNPLLQWMRTPEALMADASHYLLVIYLGFISFALFNWTASALRAMGNSRTPMVAMLLSSCLNIVLDILFIRFLPMGVCGAALATILAQFTSLFICLHALKKQKPIFPKLAPLSTDGSIKRLLSLSLPPMLRDGVIAVGGLFVQSVINTFGVQFVAGMTTAGRYFSIISMLGGSLEGAVATYCGQNTGAGLHSRIRKGIQTAVILSLAFAFITIVTSYPAAPWLIRLVTGPSDAEVLEMGTYALRCTILFLPALHMLYIFRAALQGMGDSVTPMLSGFAELGMRLFSVLVLTTAIGYTSACIADGLGWLSAACLVLVRYLYLFIKHSQSRLTAD